MGDTKFTTDLPELDNEHSAEAYSLGEQPRLTLSEDEALSFATDSVDLRALEQHLAASRTSQAETAIDWRARARAAQMNDGSQPMPMEAIALPELATAEHSFGEAEGVAGSRRRGRPANTVLAGEPAHEPIIHMPTPPMIDDEDAFFSSEPISVTAAGTMPQSQRITSKHEPIEDAVEVDLTADMMIEDEPAPLSETTDMAVLADEAAALETKVLAAGAIPPERVRFTAPLDLMIEGDRDLHRGAVLNMSSTGIACALDIELTPGQRVWVRFRLNLADEPVSLLCVVIWRRGANETHVLYGLQFTSLADEEAQRIDTTVRERLEGKAADWPLPLMPTSGTTSRPSSAKKTSGWTSAAFGMIGGMGLALALSALPHFSSQKPAELTEQLMEAPPTVTAEALPPAPTAIAFGAQGGAQMPDAIAGKMDPIDVPAVEQIVLEPKFAAAEPKAADKAPEPKLEPMKPAVVAKAEPAKAEQAKTAAKPEPAKTVAAAKVDPKKEGNLPRKASPDHAEITLASGTSSGKPHAFWLEGPHRYVVDVPGKHAANAPTAESPLVSKVRVGNYEDKTRYVFEVASAVRDAKIEPRGNALVVKLSK